MAINWQGVIPAITTPFNHDLSIDFEFLREHARWMVDAGCVGIVPGGSLGEAATLTHTEKLEIIAALAQTLQSRAPVIAGVAALSTAEAVRFVHDAEQAGASGFMVLPPYVYSTDWREMRTHISTVLGATTRPTMLYNNPLAYKTDFLPPQIAELASAFPQLEAVKESSADLRRVTWLRALLGQRLAILIGVDDLIVEGIDSGAVGWIAGLVNALPAESVALYRYAMNGEKEKVLELYHWFLPLLRLDTVPKFVQLIKLVQEKVGMGRALVRAPRLELEGTELRAALDVIERALAERPTLRVMA